MAVDVYTSLQWFIDVKEVDALLFCMGEIVIQLIGLNVLSTFCARKLILCFTGPGSEAFWCYI